MTDQGLRAALQALADARTPVSGDQLRELLAAHPAEPAPAVTDEAVEKLNRWSMPWLRAVVGSITGLSGEPHRTHGYDVGCPICKGSVEEIASALAFYGDLPTAPLLGPRPLLDREAVGRKLGLLIAVLQADDQTLLDWARCEHCPTDGPCACSGDSMLRSDLLDAVMELARPMPTREQIEAAVRKTIFQQFGTYTVVVTMITNDVTALLNGAD